MEKTLTMIDKIHEIDEFCLKIYRLFNHGGKFPQLQRSLNNYITSAPEFKMAQIPGSMKNKLQELDREALTKDEVHKGQIAQLLVRTALAIYTLIEIEKNSEINLEPIEQLVIKQVIYRYSNNQLEELFSSLAEGEISIVENDVFQAIYEETIKRLLPSDLIKLKEDLKTKSALEVLIEINTHFRYTKGLSSKINNAIAKQKEDLFLSDVIPKFSVDEIKEIALDIVSSVVSSSGFVTAFEQLVHKYIKSLQEEDIFTVEAIKKLNNEKPNRENVSHIMAEVTRQKTNLNDETIYLLFPDAAKQNKLTDTISSKS